MQTLIVHPDSKNKLTAVKAILKALNVPFEENNSSYTSEFEVKMKEGQEDIKAGRTVKITLDEIWNRAYPKGIPGSPILEKEGTQKNLKYLI